MYARVLWLAGRREEALAVRAELEERSRNEYVGPAAFLMMLVIGLEDEDATAKLIQANVDAMTGPTTIHATIRRDLDALLDHRRLGPLVRQLTLWKTWPGAASPSIR